MMARPPATDTASQSDLREASADELRALVTKSPAIGARLLESAARSGMHTAQMTLARMLLVGQGVRRDRDAAFHWFSIAAESGDPEAADMVGRCYEFGWGVAADRKSAAAHYRAAARRGLAVAQFHLAQLLLSGEPTLPQRREGLGWHLVAAKAGYAKSMNVLGRFCEEGWDMPRSIENAIGWYGKAAEGGDHWGQFNLGRLLAENGDTGQAAHWFRKAAESSNGEFLASIEPVLSARPEPEFKAIGRQIAGRATAGADHSAARRRPPRHRLRALLGRRPAGATAR